MNADWHLAPQTIENDRDCSKLESIGDLLKEPASKYSAPMDGCNRGLMSDGTTSSIFRGKENA